MCWWGNHLFVIFAVLDVSLAVNLCINCSFFTFISYKRCNAEFYFVGKIPSICSRATRRCRECGFETVLFTASRRNTFVGGICALPSALPVIISKAPQNLLECKKNKNTRLSNLTVPLKLINSRGNFIRYESVTSNFHRKDKRVADTTQHVDCTQA